MLEFHVFFVNFDSLASAEVAGLVILDVMIMAAWALDVEGLRNRRKSQKLVLFEVLAKKICFVPIKAVFAVAALAPPTAVYHTPSIGRILLAVRTLMLRAMEKHLALRLCFEVPVETCVME